MTPATTAAIALRLFSAYVILMHGPRTYLLVRDAPPAGLISGGDGPVALVVTALFVGLFALICYFASPLGRLLARGVGDAEIREN